MATRVAVFIDGSNLYRCTKEQFGRTDIDLEKLAAKTQPALKV